MSTFKRKRMKISNHISSKVLMPLLICFCAIWIFLWNQAAIVCYAKTDSDKEKVEEFVTAYYEAHTEEGIETLSDYVEDAKSAAEEMMVFKVCLEWGAEKYDNIEVVAYPLSNGIDWYTIAGYELIVEDFDIGLPGARALVVRKQKDESFVIVYDVLSMDNEENEKLLEEIRQINLSDEVCDMNNAVGAAYNDILVQNPDILEWVKDLSYAIELARADGVENLLGQENEVADMRGTYIVCKGDCLWSIAEEEFGDGMYWSSIYEANRELIGDNPDLLYVGWELNMDIPVETVYTDEECKEITFGNIKCSISKFYHIARVVEEENQTTFYAEADSKPDEPGFHGPQQRTYIVRKEPELPDSYEEAFKYFEGITEPGYFESYQTADDNTIRALYKAMDADEDKAYYLVGVSGEDGLYFIETEDILLDNSLAVLYGRKSPFVEEYCYTLSDIKCGRNYTAQVEKNIYYGEMRAEYKVTSDLLNYTAEFSAVPSEDDESKLVNTWNVTLENEPYKVPTVQWVSEALTRLGYLDYPDFDDMNADGYLDLLGYVYTPHGSRSMKTIFVWDEQEQEYVQVIRVGGSQESEWPNTFCSPHASDDRVEEWHIKYEDMIETVHYYCYRWEGNKLILDDEDEYTLVYDMEKDMYVREDEE